MDAALALADERGLTAVSMRAVAQRTRVTPMALYPYVGSKAALLDGMVGRLLGELLPPPAGGGPGPAEGGGPGPAEGGEPGPAAAGLDWRERLRSLAYAARELAHRHPWAAALLFSRPAVTADAVRAVDQIYTAMLDAGVPASVIPRLERLVSTLVLGFAASETGGRFGPADKRQRLLQAAGLPGHTAVAQWLESPVDLDAEFEADLQDLLRLVELVARNAQPAD